MEMSGKMKIIMEVEMNDMNDPDELEEAARALKQGLQYVNPSHQARVTLMVAEYVTTKVLEEAE
jgi:hypothetical protein